MAAGVSGGGLGVFSVGALAQALPRVSLQDIRNAQGNINQIRRIINYQEADGLELFKQAVAAEDYVLQIQLSQALDRIERKEDLPEKFDHLRDFSLFNEVYDKAIGEKWDFRKCEERGLKTFTQAAESGYLPARLALVNKGWENNSHSYGYAAELRPYVGQGNKALDFCFGEALSKTYKPRYVDNPPHPRYYEGLNWMHQSGFLSVKFPKQGQTFEWFVEGYAKVSFKRSNYQWAGFQFFEGGIVLAPSQEQWNTFVQENLNNAKVAPPESYQIDYHAAEIVGLSHRLKIEAVTSNEPVRAEAQHQGFRVDSLTIYAERNKIGKISVNDTNFQIYETFQDEKTQPMITFVEEVLKRSGSAISAFEWLRRMGAQC